MSFFPIVPPPLNVLSFVMEDHKFDDGAAQSYSFSVSTGSATSDRLVLVFLVASNSGSVASVSITGGASTSQVGTVSTNTGNICRIALWQAVVSSGTSATVSISFTDVKAGCMVTVVAVRGGANLTPVDIQTKANTGSGTNSVTLSHTLNGVAFGYAGLHQSGSDPTSATWTGLTELLDEVASAGERRLQTFAGDTISTTGTTSVQMVPNNVEDSGHIAVSYAPT